MEGIYNKCRKVSENLETFTGKAKIDIVDRRYDLTETDPNYSPNVNYRLDIEYRTFGIKSITVIPEGEIEIDYIGIDNAEVEHQKTIKVDASKLAIEWTEGGSLSPYELHIEIDKEGNIDYKRSYINFTYVKP